MANVYTHTYTLAGGEERVGFINENGESKYVDGRQRIMPVPDARKKEFFTKNSPSPDPYVLSTEVGSPQKVRHIGVGALPGLADKGILTEAQLFGSLLEHMGGATSAEEAEEKFGRFIRFLTTVGVPAAHAERAAQDMRVRCKPGLVLEFDPSLATTARWTTSEIDADRQQRIVDGMCDMHLNHDGHSGRKLMGHGPRATSELDWASGYHAYAQFLAGLNGDESVDQAITGMTDEYRNEVIARFAPTIGHQIMLEFKNGTYTKTKKLFYEE